MLSARGLSIAYDCHDPPIETMGMLYGQGPIGKLLTASVSAADILLRTCVGAVLSVSPGVDATLRRHGWRMPIFRFYNTHAIEASVVRTSGSARLRSVAGWCDARILIYIGGIQPGIRGIEVQMEAVSLARRAGQNVKFAAFGWGESAVFLALAKRLGISDHVRFSGPVPREEIPSLLGEATFAALSVVPFALPSKLFEYIASGLRVVCASEMGDAIALCRDYISVYDGTALSLASALCVEEVQRAVPEAAAAFIASLSQENRDSVARILGI